MTPGTSRAPAASRKSVQGRLATLQNQRARYVVFFATYFYQGLVAGFSLTALANHYAGLGVPASEVGLHFAAAGLPWTVQPYLWGPLIDRAGDTRMGRRRPFAVIAILGAQLCLGGLCLVPGPPAMLWIGVVLFSHSVFASLLDTACDRMILDHVPGHQLGRMSACTRSGFVTGTSLGAVLFGWLLSEAGFEQAALTLLLLGTVALLPALLVRECPGDAFLARSGRAAIDRGRHPFFGRFMRRLALGLRRPSAMRLLALCFGIDFGLALFEVRFGVDLVQAHGWDAPALSRLQAMLALVSGTAGAFAVGWWSDRSGPLSAMTGLFLAGAASYALSSGLIVADLVGSAGPAILSLTNVLPSLVIVAVVPALMQSSRGRAGSATQFEVYMAMMNFGSVVGGAVSGVIAIVPMASIALVVAAIFLTSAAMSRRPELIFRQRPKRSGQTQLARQ